MNATLRYVLLTALRDRFVVAIVLILGAVMGVARLMSASALTEGREMGLAFAGELSRMAVVLGMVIFICFHVQRMYETKEIEAILSRPISRASFVLAYFVGFGAVAALLVLMLVPLLTLVMHAGGLGLLEWEASLLLECLIVVAGSLFCATSLSSATAAVLASLGFYALSREAAFFVNIARHRTAGFASAWVDTGSRWVMEAVASVTPRLDLFGQSRWLVTGPGGDWGMELLLVQAAIIVPLLLLATIRDLNSRRF